MLQNHLNQCTAAKNVLYSYCDDIKENSIDKKVHTSILWCYYLHLGMFYSSFPKNSFCVSLWRKKLCRDEAVLVVRGSKNLVSLVWVLFFKFCSQNFIRNFFLLLSVHNWTFFKMKYWVNNEMFRKYTRRTFSLKPPNLFYMFIQASRLCTLEFSKRGSRPKRSIKNRRAT